MLKKLKIQAEDALRYNPVIRNLLASSILLKSRKMQPSNTCEAAHNVQKLCQAARLAATEPIRLKAEAAIARQLSMIDPAQIPWSEFLSDYGLESIRKTIVLKRYVSEREKGVVFVSFDNQMARLAKSSALQTFADRYTLVLSPQWSPPHTVVAYLFPLLYPDPIHCLISNPHDLEMFPRISDKYKTTELYASNWFDPRRYTPVPFEEKNIDILMVANFGKFKRHHAFFSALRDLPRDYRVVLVGQSQDGRDSNTVLTEAAAFGVRDRFEIRADVPYDKLQELMAHAKTTLVLSRREGSCVVVVESMFANTPVAVYVDAEMGSRVFVNEHTGCLLRHENLGAQLKQFVEASSQFSPRKWAMENGVDCVSSTRTLNQALKQQALDSGSEWTEDIATLCWRPDPVYYDAADYQRLLPSYQDIQQRCGINIAVNIPAG
jgi:glycosyltransferase involved in cell wall biosynthesis